MTPGVVFLIFALCGVALSLWARWTRADVHFGVQIVLYVVGAMVAIGFGGLAALSFLIGSLI